MRFFDIPYDPLVNNFARFIDYESLRRLSCTSRIGRETFYSLTICFESDDRELDKVIINQIIFAIIHSERLFQSLEFRKKVYNSVKRANIQTNTPIQIRFLRYLLLHVLDMHYGVGNLIDRGEYVQRMVQQLKIMPTPISSFYRALYHHKFKIIIGCENTPPSFDKYYLPDIRFEILHHHIALKQDATALIQTVIDKLIHQFEGKKAVFSSSAQALKEIKLILSITNLPKKDLNINFDVLLSHLGKKFRSIDILDIILTCISLNKSTSALDYKLYNTLLSKWVYIVMTTIIEKNEISNYVNITIRLLDMVLLIVPFLTQSKKYILLFKITGLSLCNEISEIVRNYLSSHFDIKCFKDKKFVEKLQNINIKSSKVNLYCLFAIKSMYLNLVLIDVSFIIDWRIKKISVLNPSSNQPLLLMSSHHFTAAQINAMYERFKNELELNNRHDIEDVMWAQTQAVTPSWAVIIKTNIHQQAVFQILSIIEDRLDQNQSLVLSTIIVQIAYDTYFGSCLENDCPIITKTLSLFFSRILQKDKLKLIATIMGMNRSKSSFRNKFLNKANPNCLVHLLDPDTLKKIHLSDMSSFDKLTLMDYLDLEKVTHENRTYFIEILSILMNKMINKSTYLDLNCADYARWILMLEKYVSIDDNTTIKIFKEYLILYLLMQKNNDNMDVEFFLIIRKYSHDIDFFRFVIEYLSKNTDNVNFVNQNIKALFNYHDEIPESWISLFITKINSNNFSDIKAAVDIISALVVNHLLPMSDLLCSQLKIGVNNLLRQPFTHDHYENILIVGALYFPINELIDWINLIIADGSEIKIFYKYPTLCIRSQFDKMILNIPLSFDDLMIFMSFQDERICYLAYYYIGMNAPTLSGQQCTILFDNILHALSMGKSIPVFIITIIANYQEPIHYQRTSAILRKFLFENNNIQKSDIIETKNFCKLVKPLLEVFDEITRTTIIDLIRLYIESRNALESKDVNLLSNLCGLCPVIPVDTEDILMGRLTL